MAYHRNRRTVRCSLCNTVGHSKRACPELPKYLASAKEKQRKRAAGEPGDHWIDFRERAALEQAQANKERKARPRLCRYCATHFNIDTRKDKDYGYSYDVDTEGVKESSGHNVRTCQRLKDDIQEVVKLTVQKRRDLVRWAEENHFASGALVQSVARYDDTTTGDDDNYTIYLVTNIDLSAVVYDPKMGDHRYGVDTPGGFDDISWNGIVVGQGDGVPRWNRRSPGDEFSSGAFVKGMPHLCENYRPSFRIVEPAPDDEKVELSVGFYSPRNKDLLARAKGICRRRMDG